MKKLLLVAFAVCLMVPAAYAITTHTYSWEDGTGTDMGQYGNVSVSENISGPHTGNTGPPGTPYTCPGAGDGMYYLHTQEAPHSSTPYVMVACITGLAYGDTVHAELLCYDVSPDLSPSGRLWGGYHDAVTCIDCPGVYVSSAGSGYYNSGYSPGLGWDQMQASWEFNAVGDPTWTSLVIQARMYSSPSTCDTCYSDFYFDLIEVHVPDYASVRFPDFGPSAVESGSWGSIKALYR
ncbi:MAG: hypothetical protein ABIJ00_00720 [Candidatus Eisenbacteria bacterium]